MSASHDMGANDDVSCLNIELELILERLLVCVIFFGLFLFLRLAKTSEFRIVLERLLEDL
jgi:hypothetical protein